MKYQEKILRGKKKKSWYRASYIRHLFCCIGVVVVVDHGVVVVVGSHAVAVVVVDVVAGVVRDTVHLS